ncbi:MAG: transposase [Verrucomicrobiota bacterium]|jgi:putative DNA methylase
MSLQGNHSPSLIPSFPLSPKQTARVMTNVESPGPHQGWYSRGYLPHWDHPGMMQSINFRLGDSMPAGVIEKWKTELTLQSESQRSVELRRRIEKYLDAGHGTCWLNQPDIACLAERALFHFDGQRYRLLAWCIMPNHIHALIETREGFPLADVLHSWKSFTSHKANASLRRTGGFWEREYLDRFVRNAEHYAKVVAYIEENPVKAGLARLKRDWPWSSARFRVLGDAAAPAVGFGKEARHQLAGGTPALPGCRDGGQLT